MENNKKYYGDSNHTTISYLEFGSIDLAASKKSIWEYQLHNKAYDWLMHARYSHDIYSYLTMKDMLDDKRLPEIFSIYNNEIHHGDDSAGNLGKLIALMVAKQFMHVKHPSFFEIGQTLFGCIDGMEFYQKLLLINEVDCMPLNLKDTKWFGVDISPFFNRMSKEMHKEYKIETHLELSELEAPLNVFFAKGVTLLYACNNIAELFEVLDKGQLGFFDYSFSLEGEQKIVIGTGKKIKYLDVNEFMRVLDSSGKSVYVKRGNSRVDTETNRVWVECVYGEDAICKNYIDLDKKIRSEISTKLKKLEGSERLLNGDHSPLWVSISDYLS